MQEIAIIGGGAAGLFCSIYLKYLLEKENIKDVAVVIYERLERTGKKILVTGNGRCNFSNTNVSKNKYNNPSFVSYAIRRFGYKDLVSFFNEIGLFSIVDSEGRLYPHSESSNTVLDVLRTQIRKYKIEEKCNSEIRKIIKQDDKYILESVRNEKFTSDYVVLATGGKASQIHGSNGSGYALLKSFKHKVVDPKPGLVFIKTDPQEVKSLAGIRVKGVVNLYERKHRDTVWSEKGEILFKPEGLGGIVIMQAELFIQRNPGIYTINLDLYPELSWDEFFTELQRRVELYQKFDNQMLLTGIFSKKLTMVILKRAKVDLAGYIGDLTDRELARIVNTIKEFAFEYKGTGDFDKAQVTVGGIDTTEISNKSLESKKTSNLYVVGELLDVDGECGGYNLHWAFASAHLAATDIVNKLRVETDVKDQ